MPETTGQPPVIIVPEPVAVTPAPTHQHHENLRTFLHVFAMLTQAAVVIAPAVASPFIKNQHSADKINAALPAAGALASLLDQFSGGAGGMGGS